MKKALKEQSNEGRAFYKVRITKDECPVSEDRQDNSCEKPGSSGSLLPAL